MLFCSLFGPRTNASHIACIPRTLLLTPQFPWVPAAFKEGGNVIGAAVNCVSCAIYRQRFRSTRAKTNEDHSSNKRSEERYSSGSPGEFIIAEPARVPSQFAAPLNIDISMSRCNALRRSGSSDYPVSIMFIVCSPGMQLSLVRFKKVNFRELTATGLLAQYNGISCSCS